jgi:hypothetical protein
MKFILNTVLFFLITIEISSAFDWEQAENYRFFQYNKKIDKIEVDKENQSIFVKFSKDLKIFDYSMDSIIQDIDNPYNYDVFLNPDLKTYVLIDQQHWANMKYLIYFFVENNVAFRDNLFEFSFQKENGNLEYNHVYPFYIFEENYDFLKKGTTETSNLGSYTQIDKEYTDYYISQDFRYLYEIYYQSYLKNYKNTTKNEN